MLIKLGVINKFVDYICVVYYDVFFFLVCVMFCGWLVWLYFLEFLIGFEYLMDLVGCWVIVGLWIKLCKIGLVLEQYYWCFVIFSVQLLKGKNNGKMVNMVFDCEKFFKELILLILIVKVLFLNKFEREVRDILICYFFFYGSVLGSFLYFLF